MDGSACDKPTHGALLRQQHRLRCGVFDPNPAGLRAMHSRKHSACLSSTPGIQDSGSVASILIMPQSGRTSSAASEMNRHRPMHGGRRIVLVGFDCFLLENERTFVSSRRRQLVRR
jgi:hypothetical protein